MSYSHFTNSYTCPSLNKDVTFLEVCSLTRSHQSEEEGEIGLTRFSGNNNPEKEIREKSKGDSHCSLKCFSALLSTVYIYKLLFLRGLEVWMEVTGLSQLWVFTCSGLRGKRSEKGELLLAGLVGWPRARTPLSSRGCFLCTKAEITTPWLTLSTFTGAKVIILCLEMFVRSFTYSLVRSLTRSFILFSLMNEKFVKFYRALQFPEVSHTIPCV